MKTKDRHRQIGKESLNFKKKITPHRSSFGDQCLKVRNGSHHKLENQLIDRDLWSLYDIESIDTLLDTVH